MTPAHFVPAPSAEPDEPSSDSSDDPAAGVVIVLRVEPAPPGAEQDAPFPLHPDQAEVPFRVARVPCVGEFFSSGDEVYRVVLVCHYHRDEPDAYAAEVFGVQVDFTNVISDAYQGIQPELARLRAESEG